MKCPPSFGNIWMGKNKVGKMGERTSWGEVSFAVGDTVSFVLVWKGG